MRILLISDQPADPDTPAWLGAWKAPLKLQAALRALGHDCDLWGESATGRFPQRASLRRLASPWLIRRALNGHSYDVVECCGADAFALARTPKRHYRVVVRSHGLERLQRRATHLGREGFRPRLQLESGGIRRADAMIVPNRAEHAFIATAGWKPANAIHVIAHGADPEPYSETPRGGGVLFCGTWDPIKGVRELAAAMEILIAGGTPVPLTVLGPSVYADFAADAEADVRASFSAACQRWVTVLPRADEAEVARQMARHDILASPSWFEGCSLARLEALSRGLPLLCSATGEAPDLYDASCALVIPPRDAAALAAALLRLWQDAALRRSLAVAGRERVRHLTWRRAAEATLAVYASP